MCEHCEFEIKDRKDLLQRIRKFHIERITGCLFCEYSTTGANRVKTHVTAWHWIQPKSCHRCTYSTTQRHEMLELEFAVAPRLSTLRLTAPTSCQPASAAAYTANVNYNLYCNPNITCQNQPLPYHLVAFLCVGRLEKSRSLLFLLSSQSS